MDRSDERKQISGQGKKVPAEGERMGKVSKEADDPMGHEGEGSSMARSKGAAMRGQEKSMAYEHEEEGKRGKDSVSSAQKTRHVDADHVLGDGGSKSSPDADTFSDMASAGANRKEAGEPEREKAEEAAMGRERSVAHKNVMGHGERETIAKHTI
jgi:hypothetical protein